MAGGYGHTLGASVGVGPVENDSDLDNLIAAVSGDSNVYHLPSRPLIAFEL